MDDAQLTAEVAAELDKLIEKLNEASAKAEIFLRNADTAVVAAVRDSVQRAFENYRKPTNGRRHG